MHLDRLVDRKVISEVKATETILAVHKAQVLNNLSFSPRLPVCAPLRFIIVNACNEIETQAKSFSPIPISIAYHFKSF